MVISDKSNDCNMKVNTHRRSFLTSILRTNEPVILDVGAHKGETIKFFKEIFDLAKIYSFEPCPQAENCS